ncbi:helix-turn-helix transcriptional regulator [Burkholderia alba]|uniref:helix-turn-helix transcriptional regulator n=1 Tax=Burkholderia alba TaxID=2683677 RepID=UPI002B05B409|nr:AraC family transcriptional regulator [Burkholderia alba]
MHRVILHRCADAPIEAISLATDRAFPRHAHDQFGIGVIAAGAHRSWSGRGQVDAHAGDAIMVNPGEIHDGAPLGGARAWRMVFVEPETVRRLAAEEGLDAVELTRPAVRDPLLAAHFARLFARATAIAAQPTASSEALVRLAAHVLTHHAARPLRLAGPAPSVRRALERIDAAPAAPVTLEELAALSGVSRFQLLRGFSRDVGITPHAYLVQQRVRLARTLLASGRSIAEVAFDAGFADQSHLTRAFARQFGLTPGQYVGARVAP